MPDQNRIDSSTATCACGRLRLVLRGASTSVYACACLECQKATGSAFAYRAIFADEQILALEGERQLWRRGSDSGRWVEHNRCSECGTLLFMRAEGLMNAISVSVGCFSDSKFAAPIRFHRASRRHRWYELAEGIKVLD